MNASTRFFLKTISFIIIVFLTSISGFGKNVNEHYLMTDSLRIRVYLEGPLFNNGNVFSQNGRPLMRDNLRNLPFDGRRLIPARSPYTSIPFFAENIFRYGTVGIQNDLIVDSTTVFNVQGENAIVDWVFVEVRNQNNSGHVLATRSGLLQRDGDIVDVDGVSPVYFPGLSVTQGYVVIKHRNHLAVMSNIVNLSGLIDFTSSSFSLYDFGTTVFPSYNYTNLALKSEVKPGFKAMWAGDFDSNGQIKSENPGDDMNQLFYGLLYYSGNSGFNTNFDSGYGYFPTDFDLNGKVKFDNPDDDKNMLFAQIVSYPINTLFLPNFSLFIEQVPPVTLR